VRSAVFLDRDGVINAAIERDGQALSPRTADQFEVMDAAVRGARRLHTAGHVLVVVTNQPDIGRHLMSIDELDAMHQRMRRVIPVDSIMVCPHGGTEGCSCRKPLPGMLLEAAAELELDLDRSWMIGDRWVDVAAGRAAGVRTVLIERDYSYRGTSSGGPTADLVPTAVAVDLDDAADVVLGIRPTA
jgi:D-glycero-D-manno-heptose 1,7-bisphosphate phosphatase